MKRAAVILSIACLGWVAVCGAGEDVSDTGHEAVLDAKREAFTKFPSKYPLWLAKILARFGVAEAQALAGIQAWTYDMCKGMNWLQSAAKQHHLFAEVQLAGYYDITGKRDRDEERIKRAFLWYLHFEGHFPDEKDESHAYAVMLKLTPEQENSARETFKTWKPENDLPVEQPSCPGKTFEAY